MLFATPCTYISACAQTRFPATARYRRCRHIYVFLKDANTSQDVAPLHLRPQASVKINLSLRYKIAIFIAAVSDIGRW